MLKREEEPKAADVSHASDATKNKKNLTASQGWHQALLPKGHAQLPHCKPKPSKSPSKKRLDKAAAYGSSDPLLKDDDVSRAAASKLLSHVKKKVKTRLFCTAAQNESTIRLLKSTKSIELTPTVALRTIKTERLDDPDPPKSTEKWKK